VIHYIPDYVGRFHNMAAYECSGCMEHDCDAPLLSHELMDVVKVVQLVYTVGYRVGLKY
jgi:hypothetical protein